MIEIGGLWKKRGKKGDFLTGSLGKATLLVFPNTKKTKANQPDYRVMLAEKQDRPQPQPGGPAPQRSATAPTSEPPSDLWDRDEGSPEQFSNEF